MGVVVGPPRGDVVPSRPWGVFGESPPFNAWCRGREDMDMDVMPLEGEAIRLGSLQTEVGGATSAMSGMGEVVFGMLEYGGRGRRGKDFCCPVGSRMLKNFCSSVGRVVGEVHLGDRDTVRGDPGVKPHILFNFTIDLAAFTDFTASTVNRVNTFDQEGSPLENEM